MENSSNHQVGDEMLLISQLYPGLCTSVGPREGGTKLRRRRRKSNGEATSMSLRKRKLSVEQVNQLEKNFGNEHKLESGRKDRLASELGLDPRQVAVWFQNRRARWRSKKLEEEFSKLKTTHDAIVVEKCQLETEVLKLKEQLSEAEKEIQRLSDAVSSGSPSSSLSNKDANLQFLGEFGVGGFENLLYVPENNYIYGMEWVNPYE